MTKRPRVDCDS